MSSILERLPNEILEQIWREVLICDVIDISPAEPSPPRLTDITPNGSDTPNGSGAFRTVRPLMGNRAVRKDTPPPELSALQLTCRYLYYEANRVFFSYNNFQIKISEPTLSFPANWLSSLSTVGRSRIRKLTITFGAGNGNLLASILRGASSFDSMSLSVLVNAPHTLRERNTKAISSALLELKRVEHFKHSAVRFQFDRQTAGSLESTAWRQSWVQCLHDMSDVFTMPERDVLGVDAYKRIECASRRCSYDCDKPLLAETAVA